jgi:hypothetical protein
VIILGLLYHLGSCVSPYVAKAAGLELMRHVEATWELTTMLARY